MTYGARRLFIYYRVHAEHASAAIAAAAAMQQALRHATPALQTELLRRPIDPKAAEPHVTLMETYAIDAAAAPGGIDAGLQARIEAVARRALGAHIVGPRHVEVFEPCAS